MFSSLPQLAANFVQILYGHGRDHMTYCTELYGGT